MSIDLSIARAKNLISSFETLLEEVGELLEDSNESEERIRAKVKKIELDINKEIRLRNKSSSDIDKFSYLPALKESLMYIEKGLESNTRRKLSNCISSASSSLRYYLVNTNKYNQ